MPTREPDVELASLLRDATTATGHGTSTLFLEYLEPDLARSLRLCAIPHEFDPATLQVLQPDLSPQEAQRRCEEMAELSLVAAGAAGLSLHEILRRELFAEWLGREHHLEFTAASRRLAEYFRALAAGTAGEAKESARRRSMYHFVGADPAAGLEEFQNLFREARNQYRLSDCEILIRLVHEYDPVLGPGPASALAYEESKLAFDRGQWQKARGLLEGIIGSDQADHRLQAKAQVRLGMAFAAQGQRRAAVDAYRRAGDVLGQAVTLNNLARAQAQQEQTEAAVATESEAATLFEKAGDHRLAALARRNLAKYYRTLGRSQLAAKSYADALALYERA